VCTDLRWSDKFCWIIDRVKRRKPKFRNLNAILNGFGVENGTGRFLNKR